MKEKTVKIISPKFSLKGWNLKAFFQGYFDLIAKHWDTVIEICKWAGPMLLGLEFFKLNPTMIVPFTAIGKAVLDIVHYFLIEKTA